MGINEIMELYNRDFPQENEKEYDEFVGEVMIKLPGLVRLATYAKRKLETDTTLDTMERRMLDRIVQAVFDE